MPLRARDRDLALSRPSGAEPQICKDGQYSSVTVRVIVDLEFVEKVGNVGFHGAVGDAQPPGYGVVVQSLSDKGEHFAFSTG